MESLKLSSVQIARAHLFRKYIPIKQDISPCKDLVSLPHPRQNFTESAFIAPSHYDLF